MSYIIGTADAVPIIELRLAAQAFYREFLSELPIIYIIGTASRIIIIRAILSPFYRQQLRCFR